MIPGIKTIPETKALVFKTSCENNGSIVSADNKSIAIIKISTVEIVKVTVLNTFRFNVGISKCSCLVMKKAVLPPIKINQIQKRGLQINKMAYTLNMIWFFRLN